MKRRIKEVTKIAGDVTVAEWGRLRLDLGRSVAQPEAHPQAWETAIAMFHQRVRTRFLDPLDWILEKRAKRGEGFTVVAMLCVLIEFLESFRQGKTFVNGETTHPFEYHSSRSLFRSFLTQQEPFSRDFVDPRSADGFYANIRCGLLHEAATKQTSLIRGGRPGRIVEPIDGDPGNLIVYREELYEAIQTYVERYLRELPVDEALRHAFLRRMDALSGIRRCFYFAYGSNLLQERLADRVGCVHGGVVARLEGHRFTYDKRSKLDGTAKANVVEDPSGHVLGVCYEIDEDAMAALDKVEGGYDRRTLVVHADRHGSPRTAYAYVAKHRTPNLAPSDEYRRIIRAGARAWKLDGDYIDASL
jgi:gamma-glutamylcyclotransferase (GGCT)/AIG2-like uncharacterized protein YtfP